MPLAEKAQNTQKAQSILIVGGYADVGVMSGGGSSQVTPVGGAASVIPVGGPGLLALVGKQLIVPSSPIRALQAALPKAEISYDSGYFAEVAAARAAISDMVIVFATQWQTEGLDGPSLLLPNGQDGLIATLAVANPNVIVVLETGNPVSMPWLQEVRAVMEAWYPGQEGGAAIADVLTGKVNPSGRLPITFPANAAQAPRPSVPGLGKPDGTPVTISYDEGSNVGYRWYAAKGREPLFPFGHGLSYTKFDHGALKLTVGSMADGSKTGGSTIGDFTVTASFSITNNGDRRGADTPQLYLINAAGRPLLRLAGFEKTVLDPGEIRQISVTVDLRLLADWDGDGWLIRKGTYSFALGKSASDLGREEQIGLDEVKLKP